MKRIPVLTPLAVVLVLLAVLPPVAQAGTCRLSFQMLNLTRLVIGEVNAECGWAPPPHTTTWGNWGVESNFGNRKNSTQFEGWHWTGGSYQWNSCTSDHVRDTAGSCNYYNLDYNGNGFCDSQRDRFTERLYASFSVDYYADCPFDSNYDHQCDTAS